MRTPLVRLAVTVISATLLCGTSVLAQPLAMTDSAGHPLSMFKQIIPSERALPQHENVSPSNEATYEIPTHLRRQVVSYASREAAGYEERQKAKRVSLCNQGHFLEQCMFQKS